MVMNCSSRTFEYSSTVNNNNRPILSKSSWIERCKNRVSSIFNQGTKSTTIINKQGKEIHNHARGKLKYSFHLLFLFLFLLLTACLNFSIKRKFHHQQ